MSDKLNNSQIDTFDTIQLNTDESKPSSFFHKVLILKNVVKSSFNKFRRSFASHCDSSLLAKILDKLYFSIIKCHLKVAGTFLLAFSLVSMFVGYISNRNLFSYLTNINNFGSLIIFVISLIFLTSKRSLGDILTSSRLFSDVSIVYDQIGVLDPDSTAKKSNDSYLTAFFAGVLCGIISIFYPSATLGLFVLSIILVLLILNRPECGLLMTLFISPFFSEASAICLMFITFISLLYKFLRGKRHIDLGVTELLIILSGIYVLFRGLYPSSGYFNYGTTVKYLCLFMTAIVTISLIRTTSMLRRTVSVIMSLTRIYVLMLTLYYILCVIFDAQTINIYLSNVLLSGVYDSLTSANYVVPILSMAIPLHFAHLFDKNSNGKIKNSIFLILALICTVFFRSYVFILTVIVSCIAIVVIRKPKFALLLIPSPAAAFGIIELCKMIPENFIVNAQTPQPQNTDGFLNILSDHHAFGIGICEHLPVNMNSSSVHLLLSIGIIGVILVLIPLAFMFFTTSKFLFNKDHNADRAKVYASGLVCSAISFLVTSSITNPLSDFRVSALFVTILSLSYISGRCFDADYIVPDTVREHK